MSQKSEKMCSVSFGFCLLVGWFALANGWETTGIILAAALLHEIGHFVVLRLWGARITKLYIGLCGAVMEADTHRLSYGKELASVLAGPLANFAAAIAGRLIEGDSVLIGVNLVLCLFNLVPVRPLDGGRALQLLLCWLMGPDRGEQFARWIGIIAALALALGLAVLMRESGGSLWLLPPMAGMLAAAGREFWRNDEKICDFL